MVPGLQQRKRSQGFSLIEIMIVVAIIAILTTLAIPQFLNYQLRSKSAEARTNLGVVRLLEYTYFSEHDRFLAVAPEPPVLPGSKPVFFDPSAGFSPLGFHPEGRVHFSYGVGVSEDGTGYTADAAADIDGDGFPQFWGFAKPDDSGDLVDGTVGCDVSELTRGQIGPCGPGNGLSVF